GSRILFLESGDPSPNAIRPANARAGGQYRTMTIGLAGRSSRGPQSKGPRPFIEAPSVLPPYLTLVFVLRVVGAAAPRAGPQQPRPRGHKGQSQCPDRHDVLDAREGEFAGPDGRGKHLGRGGGRCVVDRRRGHDRRRRRGGGRGGGGSCVAS